ncbi:MAG TPA: ABC transporter substrate-binding protein [Gammaproteobacteria bacterium]|nr:ABC transporter substrate-binding protein [Gammaproteobacteria bacterium]
MNLSKICCIGILLCLTVAPASAGDPHPALALVKQTTDQMLTRLRADRDKLKQNPELVNQLVEEVVLPHFDFETISASVLGKYWKRLDADQQRRFRDAFKLLLLRTYANALVDNMDRKIEFEPVRAPPDATDVTVRTSIPQDGEFPIPVNYSLELIDKQWKVYDVEIDGLSLVANYRTTFAREINKSGLDGLIKLLEQRNQELSS